MIIDLDAVNRLKSIIVRGVNDQNQFLCKEWIKICYPYNLIDEVRFIR
jgi:hypothetical protein